ncbi:MAG TPA: YdiU family protein [Methylophilaceae bacterium]|nr:YdiU family protein [Methylophilaceae bacterium]
MHAEAQQQRPEAGWHFDNSYLSLPQPFYSRQSPTPVKDPRLVLLNRALVESLGLDADALANGEGAAVFSGNQIPQGAEPIAQAYAGHQFGHFTMLGDGRAILLGEQLTPSGERFDIQLKGSGQTVYSRRGDGRAALGPMLREYIISEAMYALGIPTTRSLAVTTTGELVFREQALPGAVLTRVAASHIRVGTFQFAAYLNDTEALRQLADYTLQRHFPGLVVEENKYLALLNAVVERQASLIAKWLHVGFIHGVMNTDNMALSGETIDYGPCAFMNTYDPATVFSSIDHQGRYAFANQPYIAQWNLARLAETLLPLLDNNAERSLELAEEAIHGFAPKFQDHWLSGMRRKLGLFTEEPDDAALVQDFLNWMQQSAADYTNTFRGLAAHARDEQNPTTEAAFAGWLGRWRQRLQSQPQTRDEAIRLMLANNPAYIPRNHQVEAALAAAVEAGDLSVLQRLIAVLAQPYRESPEHADFSTPPPASEVGYQTFCGT